MKPFKSFRTFTLDEEVDATEYVERGSKDFNNDAVRDNVNMLLTKAISVCSITPYIAFEKVSKILAVFHIHLPKTTFLEGDHGFKTFRLEQFGQVMGMRNDGEVVTKNESPYNLYFEWKQNDRGMFDVFAEIVNDSELSDLLDDVEDDINDDDALTDREEKLDEAARWRKTPGAYTEPEPDLEWSLSNGSKKSTGPKVSVADMPLSPKSLASRFPLPTNKKGKPSKVGVKARKAQIKASLAMKEESEGLDEGVIKSIMSKVGLLGLKKKTKKPLDARPKYSLGNDPYDDDPRNQIREAKKAPKLKTNAPVLRAALAKAKTELATLKAAYRTPNQTKQPSKSMSLSHPAPEPTEMETQPLSKEKEDNIHKFGYLKESASKKKKIKELAAEQRKKYTKKRGEIPPILQKGKARYNITQKEKSSLKNILAKQKQYRKTAKEITKAARANPPSMSAYHVPNETKQPAKSMPASHPAPTPKPQSFESHIEAYHSTGNKDHLKAARQHAEMEYDRERERIRRSGVTGAQHHVDNKWNTGMYKDRIKRLDALEGVPKKGLMTRIKSMFKEEDELDEQYGTNIE